MKRILTPKQRLTAAVIGMALACSSTCGLAAVDRVIQTFDTDVTAAHDDGQWPDGSSSKTIEWSAENAGSGSGSGSAKVTIRWSETNQVPGWEDSKLGITDPGGTDFAWPGIDCRPYLNIEWDVKVDVANSYPAVNGTYGGIEVIFQGWENANGNPAGLGWTKIGTVTINNTNGWQHKSVSLATYPYNLNKLVLNFNVNPGTNKVTYLVDNITLTAPPVPPPTLSLSKPVPGLALITTTAGVWDRQTIRTVGTNYSWIGAPGPVSYSVDIAKLADNAHPGLPLHIAFIPEIPSDPNRPDTDWHDTNIVFWSVANNADGTAWSTLRYKTNAPDNNGHLYDTGDLGGVGNSTPVGTWTITFSQDTNVTVTAPGGGTLATNLPLEVISIFTNASTNMQIAVGTMANGDTNRFDQMAVVNGVKISGTPGEPPVNSNFLGQPLDTNIWRAVASANAVQQIPTDAAYWLNWTIPAKGFDPLTKATLDPGTWAAVTNAGFDTAVFTHHVLLRQADLPSVNSGYFLMFKQVATKLQIILPGETAAPGTPTGKTGTPTPPTMGNAYTFTVNAVDDNWNVVKSISDNVAITCSETIASIDPLNASLVNGTATFNITLFETGTWTITATDTIDSAKAPATVSVTVTQ